MVEGETEANPLHPEAASGTAAPAVSEDESPHEQNSPQSFEIEAKGLIGDDVEPFDELRQSSWWHASLIIMGEVLGTGIMGLPSALAKLGWFFGFCAMALALGSAIFSGVLLSTVRDQFYPNAHSFADVARELHGAGSAFHRFTGAAIMINWLLILPYYLMAAASSLVSAFETWGLCYWQWALVIMALAIFPLQMRTLHALSYASGVSDAIVIVVLVLILVDFALHRDPSQANTSVGIPAETSFLESYGSLSSFVFAFQGQSMFLEIMREMKDASQFKRSLLTANGAMGFIYSITTAGVPNRIFFGAPYLPTVAVAYYYNGDAGVHALPLLDTPHVPTVAVAGFLPFSLPEGGIKSFVGVNLCFHILVSYLLTGQPLAFKLHEMIRLRPEGGLALS